VGAYGGEALAALGDPTRRAIFECLARGPKAVGEFEVTFTGLPDGQTRVELEHRNFERHGAGGAGIQAGVSSPGGWATILEGYAKIAAAA